MRGKELPCERSFSMIRLVTTCCGGVFAEGSTAYLAQTKENVQAYTVLRQELHLQYSSTDNAWGRDFRRQSHRIPWNNCVFTVALQTYRIKVHKIHVFGEKPLPIN